MPRRRVLPSLYKARKFFLTRADYAYTSLWLLYAASAVARMEVVGAGLLADREVIPQAAKLNPALFKTIYTDLLEGGTTKAVVERALLAAESYMEQRAPQAFSLVLEYFKETGDVRSARDAEDHFKKNFGVSCVTTACEYLADLGLLGKASTAVLLTKKSNTSVEELAFFATDERGQRPRINAEYAVMADPTCDVLLTNAVVLTMDPQFTIHRPGAIAVAGDSIVAVGADALRYQARGDESTVAAAW